MIEKHIPLLGEIVTKSQLKRLYNCFYVVEVLANSLEKVPVKKHSYFRWQVIKELPHPEGYRFLRTIHFSKPLREQLLVAANTIQSAATSLQISIESTLTSLKESEQVKRRRDVISILNSCIDELREPPTSIVSIPTYCLPDKPEAYISRKRMIHESGRLLHAVAETASAIASNRHTSTQKDLIEEGDDIQCFSIHTKQIGDKLLAIEDNFGWIHQRKPSRGHASLYKDEE